MRRDCEPRIVIGIIVQSRDWQLAYAQLRKINIAYTATSPIKRC